MQILLIEDDICSAEYLVKGLCESAHVVARCNIRRAWRQGVARRVRGVGPGRAGGGAGRAGHRLYAEPLRTLFCRDPDGNAIELVGVKAI